MLNQNALQQAVQGYNAIPDVPPQPTPTDMQTHIQRAQEAGQRLAGTCDALLSLIGRLYGEGQAQKESAPTPRPAGLSHEMTSALSDIENVAERLSAASQRLAQLA